ncbi:hypothetical protein BC936DRAFT_139360 [Jimgerdemannia flammicorona]|uniref:Uncharacterized protein n=1 Tax=Jimgerdemannia flammicorona TaxID=994334 RepID=A0A433DHV7_9FUNG|nr:hypothetical protein BC936DRAFT_139360 [Jimgerdemannia flammicorona]
MPDDILLSGELSIPQQHSPHNKNATKETLTLPGKLAHSGTPTGSLLLTNDIMFRYLQSGCEPTRRFFDNMFGRCSRLALLVQTSQRKRSVLQSIKVENPFIADMDDSPANKHFYPLPPTSHFLIYAECHKNTNNSSENHLESSELTALSATRPRLAIYAIQLIDPLAFANVYDMLATSKAIMKFGGAGRMHDGDGSEKQGVRVAREVEDCLKKVRPISGDGSGEINLEETLDKIEDNSVSDGEYLELDYLRRLDEIRHAAIVKPERKLLVKRPSSANVNGADSGLPSSSTSTDRKLAKRVKISAAPVVVVEGDDGHEMTASSSTVMANGTGLLPAEMALTVRGEDGVKDNTVMKRKGKGKRKLESKGQVDDGSAVLAEAGGLDVGNCTSEARQQKPVQPLNKSRPTAASTPLRTTKAPRTRDKEETHEPENKKFLKNIIVQALKLRGTIKGEHEEWKAWYTQVYQSCQFVMVSGLGFGYRRSWWGENIRRLLAKPCRGGGLVIVLEQRKKIISELIPEPELRRVVGAHLEFYDSLIVTAEATDAQEVGVDDSEEVADGTNENAA